MADEKIDVTSSHGWLHGRMAVEDHSSGVAEIGAGVDFSIRLEEVVAYHTAEPGVIAIGTTAGTFFPVIGSISTVRDIMKRAIMKEA